MNVLDASALLAFLFAEAGHDRVAELLDGALLSSVNLAEVLSRFARDGVPLVRIRAAIDDVGIEIVPFDDAQVTLAAALVPAAAGLGLSLGDRACLALAATVEGTAITADRAWQKLETQVSVRVIR